MSIDLLSPNVTDPGLIDKASAAIDWYWRHGHQRKEAHGLGGPWLDRLYSLRDQTRAIAASAESGKPRMAIWGPSQTGKSTLLSAYLDGPGVDDKGNGSPLQWSMDEPVRFVVGRDQGSDVTVLNPFNFGSDASGCVTRFTLVDQVPDPEHPVEVQLASEAQIMHALAVGYVSECQPRNAKGDKVAYTADTFRALLERQKPGGPPTRAGYEAAHGLADLVELLILSREDRFANLAGQWPKLRGEMLETPALLSGPGALDAFACELLWDSWPSLSDVYRSLAAKRRQIRERIGERPLRCSYRAAALLLDIDAYKRALEPGSAAHDKVQRLVYQDDGGPAGATLGDGGNGLRLAETEADFGLFQGLVWQLTVPVRRDLLPSMAPALAGFLETSDLLDFPGVANAYGSADRLTDEQLRAQPVRLLTEVLKRGKTASVVVSSARNLDIDGFSLLMRVGKFPAQPVQLVAGVRSWLSGYGEDLPPRDKRLPINLVLTFGANLVNQVITTGTSRQGLGPSFEQLKGLGHLAQPQVVTTFATNYPQFPDGHLVGSPEDQQNALRQIEADDAFRHQFGDNAASFEAMMTPNGGRDYFFEHLTQQAAGSVRPRLVAERHDGAVKTLAALRQEALPTAGDAAGQRNADLDAWIEAMRAILAARARDFPDQDAAAWLSRRLRTLLNVDPEKVDPLPLKALPNKVSLRAFIEKQFRGWVADKSRAPEALATGLRDSAHAARMLGHLVEAADLGAIEGFMRGDFGYLTARADALHARRFLAGKMNTELLQGRGGPTGHRPLGVGKGSVDEVLVRLAEKEDAQDFDLATAPHFLSVIEPFWKRLTTVKTAGVGQRPPQPGDAELAAIFSAPQS